MQTGGYKDKSDRNVRTVSIARILHGKKLCLRYTAGTGSLFYNILWRAGVGDLAGTRSVDSEFGGHRNGNIAGTACTDFGYRCVKRCGVDTAGAADINNQVSGVALDRDLGRTA